MGEEGRLSSFLAADYSMRYYSWLSSIGRVGWGLSCLEYAEVRLAFVLTIHTCHEDVAASLFKAQHERYRQLNALVLSRRYPWGAPYLRLPAHFEKRRAILCKYLNLKRTPSKDSAHGAPAT